jgi:putative endonuclease
LGAQAPKHGKSAQTEAGPLYKDCARIASRGRRFGANATVCVQVFMAAADNSWFVYMLRTGSGALYTGITTDTARRLGEHQSGKRGARSLRGKGPLTLVWQLPAENRAAASRLEAKLKRLGKHDKERIVRGEHQAEL